MYNSIKTKGKVFQISDHAGGFDINLRNSELDLLASTVQTGTVITEYLLDKNVLTNYKSLNFKFDIDTKTKILDITNYSEHPALDYKNFVCSFNGSDHVSRKLLVAILEKFGYFTTEYCSKNFVFTKDKLDGHITDYVGDQDNFYRKFFIADNSDVFFNKINSFGHVRFNHKKNIYNLEHKLTKSFLHIVSETMATSYYPFVTEKFLYSVVTRGLFLAYAQPGWHSHLEKYFGFKKYNTIFNYAFDKIKNPVTRLVELMCMISKFSTLSSKDWLDLYCLEHDTIEYNYDHHFSGDYLNWNKKYQQ